MFRAVAKRAALRVLPLPTLSVLALELFLRAASPKPALVLESAA